MALLIVWIDFDDAWDTHKCKNERIIVNIEGWIYMQDEI